MCSIFLKNWGINNNSNIKNLKQSHEKVKYFNKNVINILFTHHYKSFLISTKIYCVTTKIDGFTCIGGKTLLFCVNKTIYYGRINSRIIIKWEIDFCTLLNGF